MFAALMVRKKLLHETNYPGKKWPMYISLVPEGYSSNGKPGATAYDSHNDSYFWQSPYQE